jgi:hypothetical protein
MLRPLHLLDECQTTATESAAGRGIVTCSMPSGAPTRLHFDSGSGFLLEQESTTANGRTPIRVLFEDYRQVDAVRLPFRTRIILPGATITYSVTAVRHDEPVQDAVFRRPRAQ